MNRPRGRGRRNKSNNNNNNNNTNPNKHYDSNGPDVRIRGSAKQVLDKYQQYASDALRGGDRIAAEGYFQHAEHYQRIVYEIDAAVAKQREEREARNAERDSKRREEREARSETETTEDVTAEAQDEPAAKDDDGAEEVKAEKEEKPKRRKPYKKKEKVEANGALDEDDGVLKTVTRGRKKKPAKDEAEAAAE